MVNVESVILPQPKPDPAQAQAVRAIANRVIDIPTTPAICLSLLSRNAKEGGIAHDAGYRAVLDFCRATFRGAAAGSRG